MIKDHEDLAKRQRDEYDLQLQELKNQEQKLQRQQVTQDEKEKSLQVLQEKLDKLKTELELRERQQQANRMSIEKEQNDLLQLRQSLDEEEKGVKQLQAQLGKRIEDHEDLKKRQREEYDLQLQKLKNLEEKLQQQQATQDEKEKSLKVLQENLEKQKKDLQEKETIQQRQHKEQMLQLQTEREEFNKQQKRSFVLPVECLDVAVTADGHLLLAAGAHGMLEWDESGRQLSSWTPAKTATEGVDEVCTVDELQDRRVAVGLWYAETVLVLRRSAAARDSWQQQRVFQLQGTPVRLSVHAQLMAVAERGPQLALLSLTDGRELLRHDPGYMIYSVAVTADAVITASQGQVQLSDGRMQYVVDSYSHSGQLLWRQSFSERVNDLHWSQVLSVVYLALYNSHRVTAIRAVDGQHVSEVVNSSHGLKKPGRVSLSRGSRTVLAVLRGDHKTVTVYPALGLGGSKLDRQ